MYFFLTILFVAVVASFLLFREKQKVSACVFHNVQTRIAEAREFLDFTLIEQDDTFLVYSIRGEEWRVTVSSEDYNYAVFREENDEPVEAYVSKDLRKIRWFLNTRTGTVFE